ncbi:hypothetical protein FGG79_00055 [Bacillus sp. BHET2]|uniref:TlpA family protein disulfide reductase n=1 Tax=Bacillus sp. BHET2 TaxID=2583818 RepID=UPI00110D60FA|nr:hypothetical protein [Bacillus sp. BHET2]TMU86581.1 hypothetical protein FGG79_00055 [Bacillus sp. BHET2]
MMILALGIVNLLLLLGVYKELTRLQKKTNNISTFKKNIQSSGPAVGTTVAKLKLESINGESITIGDKDTVLLVVDVRCSYCSPDIDQFISASFNNKNINFMLVVNGSQEEIKKLAPTNVPDSFNTLIASKTFLMDYKVKLFPTFIVLSSSGKVMGLPKITSQLENMISTKMVNFLQ